MVRTINLLVLSSATLVAAKSTTVDLFLSFFSADEVVASVVDVDATATTFEIRYTANGYANQWDDEYGSTAQTIIQGPETVSMVYSHNAYNDDYNDGSYTEDLACKVHREEDAITCTLSNHQEFDEQTFDSVTTVSTTGLDFLYYPVTVVGGAEKLEPTPGASATETEIPASTTGGFAAKTSSGPASSPSSNGTATVTVTQSASGTGSVVTETGNAAGPAVTQNAIFAGIAAVVGALML